MKDRKTADQGEQIRRAIEEHEGQLLRYAGRLVRDPELARDVVQETLLTLCRQPQGAPQERLREWLYVVCRHRALEIVRKEKRMQPLPQQEQAAAGDPLSAAPDQAAARSEQSGRAARIIGRLPERQQEVVRLKFQSGLSYKEIARVMDLSVSNVGVILHTAVKAIRQAMADESGKAAEAGRV